MLVTVFLSVMVLALVLGNVFLSVTKPGNAAAHLQATNPLENELQQTFQNSASSKQAFEQAADRERTRMLNKRIDRLESLLLRINNAKFVARKLNGTNLVQRLNGFEQFKQDTRLEIAALKQQLAALKKNEGEGLNQNKEADRGSEEPAREEEIDEERIHDWVYHSNKP